MSAGARRYALAGLLLSLAICGWLVDGAVEVHALASVVEVSR